jgi:3-dehydroquinate synthase/shikimate kinase/3-dehydroquinate synthase
MKNQEIKFKNNSHSYSIIIGTNILGILPKKIKLLCPKTKNIAFIIDSNVPNKFKNKLKNKLKNYNLLFLSFTANEKNKSVSLVNYYLNKLLSKNFNRSDLIIAVGGGITGDVVGFVSSIFKRGINFINIPTTLLAQVDSAIGGKTGVNSKYGKNLIGSFYQPKLVISDTSFLDSLSKKQMVCGYAEILKHSIIKDKKFFNWLEINSKSLLAKNKRELTYAIKKSCEIKIHFVNKDVHEKGLRMILNFGHTFAHAIEVKNNYSKNITHGEAVLSGMILATKLSVIKKICSIKTLNQIKKIYKKNSLDFTFKKYSQKSSVDKLIPFLKNDKKNNDEKINFILLKKIGQTDLPNKNKIFLKSLKKISKLIYLY